MYKRQEKTLHKLTPEEKVGQVFMIWCRASFLNVENPEYLQLREAMEKYHVGSFAMTVHVDGPYLLRSEPYEAAELLNRLQSESKLPLLFAADFERGVSMRLMGTTVFPHAMAFGGDGKVEDAEKFGRITAEESRAIGIHWNFFPDADVNSNPANPIINTRSFGEDPKQVGDLVTAYILSLIHISAGIGRGSKLHCRGAGQIVEPKLSLRIENQMFRIRRPQVRGNVIAR